MRAALYARVSSEDQNPHMQLIDLRGFAERMGYETVAYVEKESSVKHRPVFERMLNDARQRRFDIVLVWKIDRFARSMQQFVNVVGELNSFGIPLRSITQNYQLRSERPHGQVFAWAPVPVGRVGAEHHRRARACRHEGRQAPRCALWAPAGYMQTASKSSSYTSAENPCARLPQPPAKASASCIRP